MLNDNEKLILLTLVRETIKAKLSSAKAPKLPEPSGALAEKCGAFVTLHKRGMLRGCIGNMTSSEPLVHTVQKMAIAAAFDDPRFPKLKANELGEIDIEISVLSPMQKIEDISKIEVGTHGIMITKGWHRGVLLPQVATEFGWDRATFLEQTCNKAGLQKDAWREPDAVIEIFSAQVFGEKSK